MMYLESDGDAKASSARSAAQKSLDQQWGTLRNNARLDGFAQFFELAIQEHTVRKGMSQRVRAIEPQHLKPIEGVRA